jgi:hypothetical protein
MRDITRDNFGLLIAYLLPGFVALWGAAYHVEAVQSWLRSTPPDAPTVGGFLYATLASTALGLVLSAVRWAVIDRILARLGVRQPNWDFDQFSERLAAYELLVAHHYRYYQFYANLLVALLCTYLSRLLVLKTWHGREAWLALGLLLVEGVLFVGAWDTLRKYYVRTGALLGAKPTGGGLSRGDSGCEPGESLAARGADETGRLPLDHSTGGDHDPAGESGSNPHQGTCRKRRE